jgi:uncharacterized protein YndB with AHSA1/START domain
MRVCLTTDIAAPIDRVWRALTIPEEVRVWDGVEPLDVPTHYPQPGQHARWRSALGPAVRLTASPVRADEDEIVVAAELEHDNKTRATMTATWRRFRPRT